MAKFLEQDEINKLVHLKEAHRKIKEAYKESTGKECDWDLKKGLQLSICLDEIISSCENKDFVEQIEKIQERLK